jgi:Tfp pilus assembly protein PilO
MIKNLSKEKRDQLLLVGICTVAVAVGIYFGLVKSQKRTLDKIARQASEQNEKVGSAERLVKSRGELEKGLETKAQMLKSIEQTMASGDMYSWIIMTVNRFRADRKVEIPQFSREVTVEVGMFPKFPYKAALFNVRGTAHFHDLGKFIADFENAFPYLRVQNVDLEPASQSAASGTAVEPEKLSFKMEIVALINPNVQ